MQAQPSRPVEVRAVVAQALGGQLIGCQSHFFIVVSVLVQQAQRRQQGRTLKLPGLYLLPEKVHACDRHVAYRMVRVFAIG